MISRAALMGALWLAAAACVPAGGDIPEQAPPAPQASAAPTPPLPPPPAPPAAAPEPARPASFTYAGELTQGGWIRGQVPGGTVSARLGERALALDTQGRFFAAFDRDAGPQDMLVAVLSDGRELRQNLTITPRDWQIERINVARRSGGSTAAFLERRRPELAQIVAARAIDAPSSGWSQDFIWPLTGRISGRFGSQRIYRGEPGSYHSGLDIATGGTGDPFVAPADGVVVLATDRPFSLEGNLLIIDHGQGLNSAFLHLSEIAVAQGAVVRQGQYLGRIGSTGRATGPHLHWGLKWRDTRLDPLLFVGPMP